MISQRDAFFGRLFERAREDKDIILVSADMGAPSLDQWREVLPNQYINVGIAEANAVGIATGLAHVGKKVYTYAIAPFMSLRCYEQIKLGPCVHNLPITLIGVGAGFSYEDSGPTHHTLEDLAIMSTLPNMRVITVTDSVMASMLAAIDEPNPRYIRLDRAGREPFYTDTADFAKGYHIVQRRDTGPIVFTQGDLVFSFIHEPCTLVDLFSVPWDYSQLFADLDNLTISLDNYLLVEENFGSPLYERLTKNFGTPPTLHLHVDRRRGYCYEYGGREQLRKVYGLDENSLASLLE